MKAGLEHVRAVPGRVEFVDMGQPFSVLLDYAHEPKSLEAILTEAKKLSKNHVIVVTGAQGGGRDKAKRPKMGKIAYDYADFVVVTNEDPYDEDPTIIIEDVAQGIVDAGGAEHADFEKVSDRAAAIQLALQKATAGDCVVIAGKGSETVMAIAENQKIPWSDRDMIRSVLKNLAAK
jgi:UDP-N-acetylmuramyl tripeptide synthase